MNYLFRVLIDTLSPSNEPVFLPSITRGLFVLEGDLMVEAPKRNHFQGKDSAWIGDEEIVYLAGAQGAKIVRWELVHEGAPHDGRLRSAPKATSVVRMASNIELDPACSWLLRCDKVTFPKATKAAVHVHQGPGLRYMLEGEIDAIGPGGKQHIYKPDMAFLENGIDEPVWGTMSETEQTSFLRGLLLPTAVKGRSSTRFIEESGPKPQKYQIYAERYIELPNS